MITICSFPLNIATYLPPPVNNYGTDSQPQAYSSESSQVSAYATQLLANSHDDQQNVANIWDAYTQF
jgi:hypothetical protein